MPFFSVIIPVYEGEETLEETLRSVKDQSFKDYELILINDGSTDASGTILRLFKKENPDLNITLIEQGNLGLGAARNAGIQNASGAYCAFLDADDIWRSNKLEEMHAVTHNHNGPVLVYHPVITFGIKNDKLRKARQVVSPEDLVLRGNPIVPSATIMQTEIAKKFLFSTREDYHGAEDLFLWISLLHRKYRFYFHPVPLSLYREEGGISTRLDEHLKKVINVLQHFKQEGIISEELLKKAVRRKHLEAARFHQKRKQHLEAARHYAAAHPYSIKYVMLRLLNALRIPF